MVLKEDGYHEVEEVNALEECPIPPQWQPEGEVEDNLICCVVPAGGSAIAEGDMRRRRSNLCPRLNDC